jgi:hypothetical protein
MAKKPFRAPDGMTAMARTPVLPGATPVGSLSAQLRRPRPRSATGALRRLRPSPARNLRSFRTARRTGQCDPRATFDFEKGCGSEETRSRQLAAGRPCIPPGSQAGQTKRERKKNLQFDEMLLDSRHALVFTHGSFTTIRIAFSQGFWGRPTNVAREGPRAYSGAIT